MAHRKHGSHLLSSEDLDALMDSSDYHEAPPSAARVDAAERSEQEHEPHATHQPFATLKEMFTQPRH
ncbi:hypothetical protein [Alkalilimnicola sp. S0819]|uniref:hypothetical protein n=1 Tax=Alkalilimnicola sp. S0819 TaxID=2613922 RepID=UPI0012623151|nr:hypothetical protein [Alkalilimnicola sp. S0819]KAB7623698.1 hypothetical protein F3N43_09280 [Alkalilimnicola sp. S0819]MPQ16827.1 hypothetical protein [Alkalilimnicola sp. S0819]